MEHLRIELDAAQTARKLLNASKVGEAPIPACHGVNGRDVRAVLKACKRLRTLEFIHAPHNDLEWWSVSDLNDGGYDDACEDRHMPNSWTLETLRVARCGQVPPLGEGFVSWLAARGFGESLTV